MRKSVLFLLFSFLAILCFFQVSIIQFVDPDILLWGGEKHFFYQYLLIFAILVLIICGIIYKAPLNKVWIKGLLMTQIMMLSYLVVKFIYIIWFRTLSEEDILFNYSHLKNIQPPPDGWSLISIISSMVLIVFLLTQKRKM